MFTMPKSCYLLLNHAYECDCACFQDGDTENSDETTELNNIEGLIEHCSNLIEAKYLMQHLFNACLEHAVAAAKADSQNKVGDVIRT